MKKEPYSQPRCEGIKLRYEGVLAQSPLYSMDPGNPFENNTEDNWFPTF